MKSQLKISFIICAVTALCSGGCAKHDIVKQDQPIAPAATSTSALPATSAVSTGVKAEKKENGIPAGSLKESQAALQAQQTAAANALSNAGLDKIFFDFDSYTLSAKAREELTKSADYLKTANAKVQIEGHCDELGSDDYNLALGEKRAKAAFNYLQSLGVSSGKLSTISYGKEKPADQGHDETARANNRRDEFVISK
jgi:peptidoglycan-associated lipoprotein